MTLPYHEFRYLWPPRPEKACPPNLLRHYVELGWWFQMKANGTNCTIYVQPDRKSFARGRHGDEPIARWEPGVQWAAFADRLPGSGYYVFATELLHLRGVGVYDTVLIHDILVDNGQYLVGKTYEERFLCLNAPAGEPIVPLESIGAPAGPTHEELMPGVWLVTNWRDGRWLMESGLQPYVEGVVIKNPKGRLMPCSSSSANAAWQAKCRRSTDHLSF